jgi:hypothetical protein
MKISELEEEFRRKIKAMNDEELEEFDEWFYEHGYDLLEFYDIRKELRTRMQRQRFLDYIYMYAIVFDKREFDERYDQILFSDAVEYATSR